MGRSVWLVTMFFLAFPVITQAQEDDEAPLFERSKSWFFHIGASALSGGHKQAEYFNGTYTNLSFRELYSIPVIKNEIDASAGQTTSLGEFPPQMRYQWAVQLSGSFLYYVTHSTGVFARFSGSRVASSGVFLLYAENPANPFGEPLIYEQQMRGLELRTWYMAGVRFESEPLEQAEINPFFELALVGGGIKPIRSEAVVQSKRYNLLSYDPNQTTDTRLKTGFGASMALGLISWIRDSKAVEVSANITSMRLKILADKPNAFYWSLGAGFML